MSLSINIIDFFESSFILNFKDLSPAQKVVLKSITGEPLDSETPIPIQHDFQEKAFKNEIELFKYFTDKEYYDPSIRYYDATLAVGRRGGKSNVISAGCALYFATQKDWSPYLKTSPFVTIPIISPSREQSSEVFNAIKNFILKSPYLFQTFMDGNVDGFREEYSEKEIGDTASFSGGQIKLNNKVVIRTFAADVSRVRGYASGFIILDECAWFGVEGNDAKNTDKGIFEALQPSTAQFGNQAFVLKVSSPNGQAGLMYDDYINRKEDDTLHFQIPTWYFNPNVTAEYLEKQKKKGSSYFNREYGAKYTSSEHSYLDNELIEKCIIRGIDKIDPMPEYRYVAAMDYATRTDYWTLAIGHKEYIKDDSTKEKKERVYIDLSMHWKGRQGAELDPSKIIPEICMYLQQYRVSYCISDHYAFAALRPFFLKEGCNLKEFKVTSQSKLKYMYSLQIAVNSNTLRLVHNPLAIQHLKDLREKRSLTTNQIRVEHIQGGHDDHADAIGLCVYQFDKTSPIYIGIHKNDLDDAPVTKDASGKHIAMPTAQDVADKVGLTGFYDNRKEEEAKQEEELENPSEGGDFWYIF